MIILLSGREFILAVLAMNLRLNACNSLLRCPELKAMRNRVLTAKLDRFIVPKGSNGGFLRASNTSAKFQVGIDLSAGGF